ncbi:MAG TPA: enoyl-CoA hydratase-related protein [Rhodocyclaceae bacterium]|nr:enoyl-CoA hydratase-related protein [Rhodocyclaceae bacterium]HMZ84888.1 enoyl-CoA hydratase-related protein [Rhodocyclaceae bacterium]HNA03383.1 enoyl-CoA hydratase-related protein [Rhodocyclaceae bacterium]HNB77711.1 enoyl-CoA hydratase-related protein [Rhodocyclaceae bacterium]HNC60480.1 enoyl-CoA hydratase-related protein [Rhodocyclaceae bacterium]
MRILFLTHSFNSLTQRLFSELRARGHVVSIEFDISDSVAEEAVALFRPELIVAPYLRRAIPASIWSRHVCLVVHPGIVGDRGPSALDWAIQAGEREWGVTVLQANAEMDAGDIWAAETFPMRCAKKSSLYRNEVTESATRAVLAAVERFAAPGFRPLPLARAVARGQLRPLMRQEDRRIDWSTDDTATIVAKINAADGFPGVADSLFGIACNLFDVHAEAQRPAGTAGDIVARRDGALLRLTRDGALWIGHVKRADRAGSFKLPATVAFPRETAALPESAAPLMRDDGQWGELRYREQGQVGFLAFEFYNGAMSTEQCSRLRQAYAFARSRPTRVIVLEGGTDYWSNGIHLNMIEAAGSPADASWDNINAIDDFARDVIETDTHLTVAALCGNAGAGGAFLALAADRVWARAGVILNPHYKNMGNLYGSEYWTYLLPRRVGADRARRIVGNRMPLPAPQALREEMVDACIDAPPAGFAAEVAERASALAQAPDFAARLEAKRARRADDEKTKPLAIYRDEELANMRRNFYGFDPSYHVARFHFVAKSPNSWTPRHLALHRELGWCVPEGAA